MIRSTACGNEDVEDGKNEQQTHDAVVDVVELVLFVLIVDVDAHHVHENHAQKQNEDMNIDRNSWTNDTINAEWLDDEMRVFFVFLCARASKFEHDNQKDEIEEEQKKSEDRWKNKKKLLGTRPLDRRR